MQPIILFSLIQPLTPKTLKPLTTYYYHMEQESINNEILNQLKQLRIDMEVIKQRLPEEESLPNVEEPILDVEKQLEMGLEDLRQGKIVSLN